MSSATTEEAIDPRGIGAARQPLLLVNLLRLRRAAGPQGWRAYREDLGGFAAGWIIVFVLVVATAIMLRS